MMKRMYVDPSNEGFSIPLVKQELVLSAVHRIPFPNAFCAVLHPS